MNLYSLPSNTVPTLCPAVSFCGQATELYDAVVLEQAVCSSTFLHSQFSLLKGHFFTLLAVTLYPLPCYTFFTS